MHLRATLFACLLALTPGAAARSPAWPPEVDAALARFQASTGTTNVSLRLARPQGEAYRAHRGGFDDQTVMPVASASKWLSALVLARLVERGVLRWDSTVGEWFPEAPAATHAITLAQLYSHTSGIGIDDAGCLSDRDSTLDACALDILARPLAWAPGSTFAYGGNSMQVGGAMAARASGRSWDALFLAEVVWPLGLQATDWVALASQPGYLPNPNPRVAGGARSTLSDYAVVVDMVLNGGRHGGADYLQPRTIAEMAVDRARGLPVASTPVPGLGYGIGQWVEASDAAGATIRVSSPGAFGFTPWVDWRSGSNGVVAVRGDGSAMRNALFALEADCLRALDFTRQLHPQVPRPAAPAHPRPATPAPGRVPRPARLDGQGPTH